MVAPTKRSCWAKKPVPIAVNLKKPRWCGTSGVHGRMCAPSAWVTRESAGEIGGTRAETVAIAADRQRARNIITQQPKAGALCGLASAREN